MKFIDEVKITVKSGDGGRGGLSFRREKFIPRGGPDGGDGGAGGSIILCVDEGLGTLLDLRYNNQYRAKNGAPGMGKTMHGKNGESLIVKVPPGTLVYDAETEELLCDLTRSDQQEVLLKGGMGGRGNARFATSTNRAPRHFQTGTPGEERKLRLELKLLADVGLVGLPNAGKSTLISAVSAARPKIADYPFTTLIPNLGVVSYGGYKSFVMADIPGLIEGASEGAGLGLRFLRHLGRTGLLLHVVDVYSSHDGSDPAVAAQALVRELECYSAELGQRERWLVINKMDLLAGDDRTAAVQRIVEALDWHGPVFTISAIAGEGTDELCGKIMDRLEELRAPGAGPPEPADGA